MLFKQINPYILLEIKHMNEIKNISVQPNR